jgi:hypothetical protein
MPAHVFITGPAEPSGTLFVEPDGEVTCQARVRNTGTIVDRFTIEVVGKAASWVEIEPPVLSLFPDEEGEVTLRFSPPRASHVSAGQVPFGVMVTSSEDRRSTVAEAVLEVGAATEVFAELIPRTSRGRRTGRHQLAIDNRGNVPLDIEIASADRDGEMRVRVEPPKLRVEPGAAAFAKVTVKPETGFWRGPAQTKPFGLQVNYGQNEPYPVEGTMLQEAKLPKWLAPVAIAAVASVAALAVMWFGLLRPQIESAARTAVAKEAQGATQAAAKANDQAAAAAKDAGDAATKANEAAKEAEGAKKTAEKMDAKSEKVDEIINNPNVQDVVKGEGGLDGTPFDGRLVVEAAVGDDGNDTLTVPANTILSLTDLVIENSQGDTGTLTLRRGDAILLSVGLENIRLYDLHYVSPIRVDAGQTLTMSVDCVASTAAGSECRAAIDMSGFTNAKPKAKKTLPGQGPQTVEND